MYVCIFTYIHTYIYINSSSVSERSNCGRERIKCVRESNNSRGSKSVRARSNCVRQSNSVSERSKSVRARSSFVRESNNSRGSNSNSVSKRSKSVRARSKNVSASALRTVPCPRFQWKFLK
jgi:hypothetical protein